MRLRELKRARVYTYRPTHFIKLGWLVCQQLLSIRDSLAQVTDLERRRTTNNSLRSLSSRRATTEFNQVSWPITINNIDRSHSHIDHTLTSPGASSCCVVAGGGAAADRRLASPRLNPIHTTIHPPPSTLHHPPSTLHPPPRAASRGCAARCRASCWGA